MSLCVLGLAPTASRLSVRFWQVDTLGVLARRIAQHAEDLRLDPLPWRTEPSAYRLVLATVPHREGAKPKADDAINIVIGETMRAILSGGPYPRSLLANTIMRFRAGGDISGLRVALCKGVLARERRRDIRTSEEEIPVSLDKQSTKPGYLLGRLFAVLEHVQRAALGSQVNATIRDRFYGAASATPASIFPVLLRNTQNHLGILRKERMGQAVNLDKDIREIVGGLAESGMGTFRDKDGIWTRYDLEDVATPEGFARNPVLVHDFYYARRRALQDALPNAAHHALARLEQAVSAAGGELLLVTQNVDNLHEKASSKNLLHMHGELARVKCDACGATVDWADDLFQDMPCWRCGGVGGLRPDVVWFGEMPYGMDDIYGRLASCDLFVSIGTSGEVYPAAGFVMEAGMAGAHTLELNLEPSANARGFREGRYGPASEVVAQWVDDFTAKLRS